MRIFCGVLALVGLSIMFYIYFVWDPLCVRHVGVVTLCNDVCEQGGCVTLCDDYEISGRLTRCGATGTLIQGKFIGDENLWRSPEVLELLRNNLWYGSSSKV